MDHLTSRSLSDRHGDRGTGRSSERLERLERTIENELVPRLMTSHRVGPVSPGAASAAARVLSPDDVQTFVAAVRSQDDGRGSQFVRTVLAEGATVEAVYLDLLAPSARRLGDMWDNDECDFVEVTVALGRMQRLLRDLSQVFLAESGHAEPVGNILLTCVPGEQHTLGIIMVGEFLLRDGWRVLVGAPWTDSDLLSMVASEWYDVIGFSVGTESRLSVLRRDIRRLKQASRNPQRAGHGGRAALCGRSVGGRTGWRQCHCHRCARGALGGAVAAAGGSRRRGFVFHCGGTRRVWPVP
jgi:methanogenic corrinoid protein MtbC1